MIAEIHGGYGLIKNLQNIGIRSGKKISGEGFDGEN